LRVERRRQSREDERQRHQFTDEECESLVALKEADAANRSNTAVADIMDNNTGALGVENETIGGESGVI
jgi:hypothetical protein